MASTEVIDLTGPSPSPRARLDEEVLLVTNIKSLELKKTRRKRPKKTSTNASPSATAPASRSDSPERHGDSERRVKRKRKDTLEDTELEQSSKHSRRESNTDANGGDAQFLFFVDLNSTTVPTIPLALGDATEPKVETEGKLLLPAHVTVFGSTPVEIIAPPPSYDTEDEDFINYLDYDDAKDALRYYHEPPDQAAALGRTVCKNCGAEGEHKTSACPVEICLTCGARDEHSTRSCPISKVCFTCGMKGHINMNCPNRRSAKALMSNREQECDRCSASSHKTNECPTWWRLYEYFDSDGQQRTLALRQTKKDMTLGKGGEGYVADDEWCYNCGSCGHWGDDCDELSNRRDSEEHSAFSMANVMKGPFYDPKAKPKASTSRSHVRDWEQTDRFSAMDGVGRQGRMKSRTALESQARQMEDDGDDWFGRSMQKRNNGGGPSQRPPPTQPKKMSFGKSFGGGRQYAPPDSRDPPSLLARLGDYHQGDSRSSGRSSKRDYDHGSSSRHHQKDRHRERNDRSSSHYSDKSRHRDYDSGPRYKGGYSR